VVSIAGQQTVTKQGQSGVSQQSVVPVTLALEAQGALAVTYSSAFAQEVRLVALPLDVGTNRAREKDTFDAGSLGGKAATPAPGGGSLGGFGAGDAAQTPSTTGFEASPEALDRPWTLGLAYSYSGGYGYGPDWSSNRYLNATVGANLSRAWRLEYLASYDFNQHSMQTQSFALTRDLHCWFASFSRSFVVNGEAEYYFRLGLKDLREIYYERGTRVQNFGGIQ